MINFLAICGCVIGMTVSLSCALGKLKAVYVLSIVNGFVFVALNSCIALASPAQAGVALMIIPSIWMVGTSAFGLLRLKRESASVRP